MKQTPPTKTSYLSPYNTPSPKTKSPRNFQEAVTEEQKPLSSTLGPPDNYSIFNQNQRPEFQFQNYVEKGYKIVLEPDLSYSSNIENDEFLKKFESHAGILENWKTYSTRKTKEEKAQQYENACKSLKCTNVQHRFPDKVTLNNTFKEKWLDDLSNNRKTLRELGNELPHGFTAENLVDILYKKQIPLLNASWLIKLACLSQFTKKKVVDLTNKWTEIFLNYLNETLKDKEYHKKVKYLMLLEKHCIEEGLLDQEEIENWIIKQFEEGISFLKEEQTWFLENVFFQSSNQDEYFILIQKYIKHPLIFENIQLLKNSPKLYYFFKYFLSKKKIKEVKKNKMINLPCNLLIEELDLFISHGDYNRIMSYFLELNQELLNTIFNWNYTRSFEYSFLISFEIINKLLINEEIKNNFQFYLKNYLKENYQNVLNNKSSFNLLKELIKFNLFDYENFIKNECQNFDKLIEKLPIFTNNLLNIRRNYLFGAKFKLNEMDIIFKINLKFKEFLTRGINFNIENEFYEIISLNLFDFKEIDYNLEKVIKLLEIYSEYSLLCDISLFYLNKNEINLKILALIFQYKEFFISNYKINDLIRILIKKSENSTKDSQKIIQEFILKIQALYPNIINTDLFKKELNSIFIFDESILNYKSNVIDKDLSIELLRIISNYDSNTIKNLKTLKLKNNDIQAIVKYSCIEYFKNNENYLNFLIEFYLNGQFSSNELCDIVMNIFKNNSDDSIEYFIKKLIEKGLITSENSFEIVKGLLSYCSNLIKENLKQTTTISNQIIKITSVYLNLFFNLIKDLRYSASIIPRMIFWIYDFLNFKDFEVILNKIQQELFKLLKFKPYLISKILEDDKESKLNLFQNFNNQNLTSTLNLFLKESNQWNIWLNSLYFNDKFKNSSDEIFNYQSTNSIDNYSIFYQLITPQKEVREKLLYKILNSSLEVYKVELILLQLLKYDDLKMNEDILNYIIKEISILLKQSRSISIISLRNDINLNSILIYLNLFYYFIKKVKISNYVEIILSFFETKFSIIEEYNNLLYNILNYSFSKLDEISKNKIKKCLNDSKKLPQKFGWNIIEDYIFNCNTCNAIHGNLPPNNAIPDQRSKIVKKVAKRKK